MVITILFVRFIGYLGSSVTIGTSRVLRGVRADHGSRGIGASVVHGKNFELAQALGADALKAGRERSLGVVEGQDHGDPRLLLHRQRSFSCFDLRYLPEEALA